MHHRSSLVCIPEVTMPREAYRGLRYRELRYILPRSILGSYSARTSARPRAPPCVAPALATAYFLVQSLTNCNVQQQSSTWCWQPTMSPTRPRGGSRLRTVGMPFDGTSITGRRNTILVTDNAMVRVQRRSKQSSNSVRPTPASQHLVSNKC